MYEQIRNDKYIIDIYNGIEEKQKTELWINHSWHHINKVIKVTEYILNKLNCSDEVIDCGKIAALLHDMGNFVGRDNHAENSYEMAKEFFKDKNISGENQKIILEAIKNHGGRDNSDNLIELVLVFADKVDFDKERILSIGKTIEGQREMDNIERVDIDLDDENLNVNFITNEKLNIEELEKFYFVPKIFKAINNLSNYLKVKSNIRMNGEPWTLKIN